jgi:hypothetical protein
VILRSSFQKESLLLFLSLVSRTLFFNKRNVKFTNLEFKFKNNKFEEIITPMAPGYNTQKLQYQNWSLE